jgi:DNA-dependent RNA polymerase auxiliary subunit epsilon
MEQGQIIGLKKKLKKNNDNALEFIQKLESTLTDFEKTGDFSGSYSEIKKTILEYKDKVIDF